MAAMPTFPWAAVVGSLYREGIGREAYFGSILLSCAPIPGRVSKTPTSRIMLQPIGLSPNYQQSATRSGTGSGVPCALPPNTAPLDQESHCDSD
jgi:hypothetical protein